jgi:threonine/homoserine/homoserine lactone efflux protein
VTSGQRLVVFALLWLALFSILVSLGVKTGAWPQLSSGAFRGVDLAAGVLFGVALLFALLWRRRKDPRRPDPD